MADNFIANPGAGGDTFAADDVAGVKYPISKLDIGADGVSSPVTAANPLPVELTDGTNPVVIKQLSAVPVATDAALVTQAIIHGRTTAGGGSFVDVKVNPSGALSADISDSTNVGVNLTAAGADYWPGYTGVESTGQQPLHVDPSGALITRGAVLTDEGTFRVNFANTSLAVSIGTVTISGAVVTGSGFMTNNSRDVHFHDYFKLDADGESAWVQIENVDSDTQLTLVSSYVGGTSGAASRALVQPITGSGGSISVASGACTLASGTTNAASTQIRRTVDYAPLVYRAALSISQRIANQTIFAGLSEPDTILDRWYARFRFDGTTNTSVICETARNPTTTPSGAEIQAVTVTLPNGLTTATSNEYRVEVLTERVVFYINGVPVSENSRVIPSQHDDMEASVRVTNGTGAASSTNVVVDYMTGKNHNKLEIGVMSDIEKIVAAAVPLQSYSYNVAGVIAINTDLIVLDCSQIRSLFIQCTSMGTTGVVTVQWADDAAFTAPITATLLSESGATSTTFNAAVKRVTNVMARYCRLRLTTATTAGTTTINVWGNQVPYVPIITTQPVSGTVGVTGYPTAAASADGLANPTITQIGAAALNFNGTTWDRARNNISVAVDTSSARTASGTGVTFTNHNGSAVSFWLNVTAVSGTTPTMTVRVQWSPDNGTTWVDMDTTNLQTASITATGNFTLSVGPGLPVTANRSANQVAPRLMRLAWTIGGTTPSFTFVSWANTSA